MPSPIWPESYPNLVEKAHLYRSAGQYLDAGIEFLKAASVAPWDAIRTEHLKTAWCCYERHAGRVSELEAA